MREFLFRGKDVGSDKWVYGAFIPDVMETLYGDEGLDGFIKFYNTDIKKSETVEVERKTVGLYTGCKDKNGEKIFEGDIVKYGDTIHIVVFETRNNTAYFGLTYSPEETRPFGHYQDLHKIEVIGNIFDNPELIGAEKN